LSGSLENKATKPLVEFNFSTISCVNFNLSIL
jgi:hypothetical protein